MCDRWINSVENFLIDMGLAPEGTTLDRIDVDKDYCPENCKWSTIQEQANNRQSTIRMPNGQSLKSFCLERNLKYGHYRYLHKVKLVSTEDIYKLYNEIK